MNHSHSSDAIEIQRAYYARTAANYDAAHLDEDPEHKVALRLLESFACQVGHGSFLDVGAGTGRGVTYLQKAFPDAHVIGVEPVKEMRECGAARGDVLPGSLIEGDALCLPFDDSSFDWVIETAVLHHVADFRAATREMVRVARCGVLISDSNNIGQGSRVARLVKRALKSAGLWKAAIWLQTRGKMYKESEGDGVSYSFSAFDTVKTIRKKFPNVYFMNTTSAEPNIYATASHVAIIAHR
ncbi:class I SAM-dependent methyltransferase [Limibaculum sp. FT325]|uniref:class I SAM-dependent methyltransferase n=1 Tax=Thermohalobaculum sediminis TaxID=2939436 RepID=UPI0020C10DA6|nr:class I SAM-dependent methyltransferase [Limibaculum sediminis]MCL5776855.1 class I SAM-dependent methyltransferase [Limibaculum sediminis]